jgi:uncharacterized protein with FMN-binding domain
MTGRPPNISNSLVALGAAAVLSVYAAGYVRTRSSAERLLVAEGRQRPAPAGARVTEDRASQSPPGRLLDSSSSRLDRAPAFPSVPRTEVSIESPSGPVPAPSVPSPNATVKADRSPASPESVPTPLLSASTAASSPPIAADKEPPVEPVPVVPAQDAAPIAAPAVERQGPYKDGTYFGWGTSRHGDIQASVVIENGRIASTAIAQCRTRYTCDVIAHLPKQVMARQTPDVDVVGGATESSDAFYWAVFDALSRAK